MTRLFARALGCLALFGHVLACSSDPDARYPRRPSQESAYIRDYFYAGGSWVDDGTGQGTRVLQGQMYVERLSPPFGATHPYPLVFVHGSGQTGTVRFAFICAVGFAISFAYLLLPCRTFLIHPMVGRVGRLGSLTTDTK